MSWALVTMICVRFCQPQYVELYPTKEACVAKLEKQGAFSAQNHYCVPVALRSEK